VQLVAAASTPHYMSCHLIMAAPKLQIPSLEMLVALTLYPVGKCGEGEIGGCTHKSFLCEPAHIAICNLEGGAGYQGTRLYRSPPLFPEPAAVVWR